MANATQKKKDDEELIIRCKFTGDRRTFAISVEDLTSREQVEIEEFFNMPFPMALSAGWLLSSHKGLVFLAYLARKRKDPSWTYEQTLDSFDEVVEKDETTPPTKGSKATGSQS